MSDDGPVEVLAAIQALRALAGVPLKKSAQLRLLAALLTACPDMDDFAVKTIARMAD